MEFKPEALVPELFIDGQKAHTHDASVQVEEADCQYMQPFKFALAQMMGSKYDFAKTTNACTHIRITLPNLKMDVVAVPAAHETDGVKMNYFNVNVEGWKHSADLSNLSGILSHCYDNSIKDKKCPQCFNDNRKSLSDFPLAAHGVQAARKSSLGKHTQKLTSETGMKVSSDQFSSFIVW